MAVHSSGIRDSGAQFQIVPNTRKIIVPQSHKVIGVVGDHLSEQVTFRCPKFIDGHDIKGCTDHYLSWETQSGEVGNDALELIGEDEEFLVYAWNIRGNTTIEAGVVAFSIHFKCISSAGVTLYHWGTNDCKECEILSCVNHAIGVYELIYVDGDTLVFADYTPVRDESIMLETPGIVPEGNKFIDTNGHYDVAGLASVDVAVPRNNPITLELQDGGLMVATDGITTLTHQLETPKIYYSAGKFEASANGLSTNQDVLISPLFKRTTVIVDFFTTGFVYRQDVDNANHTLKTYEHYVGDNQEHRLEYTPIIGSIMSFYKGYGLKPQVTVEGYPKAVKGERVDPITKGTVVDVEIPMVEDGTVLNITVL